MKAKSRKFSISGKKGKKGCRRFMAIIDDAIRAVSEVLGFPLRGDAENAGRYGVELSTTIEFTEVELALLKNHTDVCALVTKKIRATRDGLVSALENKMLEIERMRAAYEREKSNTN